MRAILAATLLVAVACRGTTAPTARVEPTVAPPGPVATAPTSSVAEKTTRTEVTCTEQGGVYATKRGFLCPPYMKMLDRVQLSFAESEYLPGTYELRLFEPRFEFTRTERFRSVGEDDFVVQLDVKPSQAMYALAPEVAVGLDQARLEATEWAQNLSIEEVEVLGSPAAWIQFDTDGCPCLFPLPILEDWGFGDDLRVAWAVVDIEDGPIGLQMSADTSRFDDYFAETARPILDSIRFLDR